VKAETVGASEMTTTSKVIRVQFTGWLSSKHIDVATMDEARNIWVAEWNKPYTYKNTDTLRSEQAQWGMWEIIDLMTSRVIASGERAK
jgi:hypothetical protein